MAQLIGWALVAFSLSIRNSTIALLRIQETSEKVY